MPNSFVGGLVAQDLTEYRFCLGEPPCSMMLNGDPHRPINRQAGHFCDVYPMEERDTVTTEASIDPASRLATMPAELSVH